MGARWVQSPQVTNQAGRFKKAELLVHLILHLGLVTNFNFSRFLTDSTMPLNVTDWAMMLNLVYYIFNFDL